MLNLMNRKKVITADCLLCGEVEFRWLFIKKGRDFWKCSKCGIEKQIPLPSEIELADYYDKEYSEGLYEVFANADKMKKLTARQRLREIKPFTGLHGEWLDIGCANGVFIREARKQGVNAQGLELSEVAVLQAKKHDIPVRCGSIDDLEEGEQFDCITAFDVIAHVLDPAAFLRETVTHLRPQGHFVLTTPNKASISRLLMGKHWYFYMPEEHLHYFDPHIISKLLNKVGLEVVSIRHASKPLTFDYSLAQFAEYNTGIYQILNTLSAILPKKFREWIISIYIGELMVICRLHS